MQNPSQAEIDVINEQSIAFEEGLNAVISGALAAEYQPAAIAAGLTGSLARVVIAVLLGNGSELESESIKGVIIPMISETVDVMVSEIKSNGDKFADVKVAA